MRFNCYLRFNLKSRGMIADCDSISIVRLIPMGGVKVKGLQELSPPSTSNTIYSFYSVFYKGTCHLA